MKKSTQRKSKGLSRDSALGAAPVTFPPIRTEQKEGKLYVTVAFARPRWQQWLGGEETCERSFGLDAFGQEIYHACDGQQSVRDIIDSFAAKHHLHPAEAELNVTTFLKTLISKGLIGIPLEHTSPSTQPENSDV
jgi:hypothetical protein